MCVGFLMLENSCQFGLFEEFVSENLCGDVMCRAMSSRCVYDIFCYLVLYDVRKLWQDGDNCNCNVFKQYELPQPYHSQQFETLRHRIVCVCS